MLFQVSVQQLFDKLYFTLQCFQFVARFDDVFAAAAAEERPAHRAWL
jgi:hypothetical protein